MKDLQDTPALLEARESLCGHYRDIITLLGEDPNREGLQKTPMRVAKAMQFLLRGYDEDPEAVLASAMFQEEDYKQMVIVKDIDFFSLCEHHILPFFGKVHVAYIPRRYITGLSKIPRVVDIFSHRLQIQERLTLQIKECQIYVINVGMRFDGICRYKFKYCYKRGAYELKRHWCSKG